MKPPTDVNSIERLRLLLPNVTGVSLVAMAWAGPISPRN